MVELELQYLYEIGRVSEPAETVRSTLEAKLGIKTCTASFSNVIQEAIHHQWTRDPFDRLITAQASLGRKLLLTKNLSSQRHYDLASWEN